MSLWHPDPSQGFSTSQGQVIIGRPMIPLYGPPQGIGGVVPPPIVGDKILAKFPAIGDLDYTNYKFYQVNKGEFSTPQTDFIWEITDTVGPGVFQEASGFDIRPFLNNERDIASAIDNNNGFDPGFTLQVVQLSDDELHLFCWQFGGDIHEWVLPAPHVFPPDSTPSDFTFSDPEMNSRDLKIMDNGTKMATCGIDDDTIRLYSLPSKNSFATTPILLDSFDITFMGMNPESCDFSRDGMELYILVGDQNEVIQYHLASPFTLPAPSTLPDREFDYSPQVTSIGNTRMFSDGSAFYMMTSVNDIIAKYINTDGNYQIPTVNKAPDASFDVAPFGGNTRALSLSVDGSLLWFSGRNPNNTITELFIPGQLLEYEVVSVNVSTGDFTIKVKIPTIQDLTFVQLAIGNSSATDGSTTFPPSASFSGNEIFTLGEDGADRGATISSDGFTLFTMQSGLSAKIIQYDLSIANDLSTAVLSGNTLSINTEDLQPRGVTISNDGKTLFVVGETSKTIYQYTLPTANSLLGAFFSNNDLLISDEDITPEGLTISSDGLTMFMAGETNKKIYQYNLPTANSLISAVFSGNDLLVTDQDTSPKGLTISSNGFTLFMIGGINKEIYQYTLPTANSLVGASFSNNKILISVQDSSPEGLTISNDGTRIFMLGSFNRKIYQYNLSFANSLGGAILSTFDTPLLTKDEDNFLVDDQDRNIVEVVA